MDTDFLFNDFLNYLAREKQYSKHTLTAYRKDLAQFWAYATEAYGISNIHDINSSIVRSFVAELMNEGLESRSVNRKISTLKSYFKFHLQQKGLIENPMKKVVSPKNPKRLPTFVDQGKMEDLLTQLSAESAVFSRLRDLLVIELLYGTGIRLSEAIGLKESDINLTSYQIKVLGKRNKERIIPITHNLAELIQLYIQEKKTGGFECEHLIVTDKGRMAYPKFIYTIVKQQLGTVSTLKKKSPHVLRHSYATHLLDNGAELNAIKELLGHSSLAATQVYTHNSIERLKEVYRKAHPKS